MNYDNYGEVINGEKTFKKIAEELFDYGRCIVGWTDQEYDHRDIMFVYRTSKYGNLQRGLKATDLYVSIMGFSSMGFSTGDKRSNIKHYGYIMEKLFLEDNACNQKICDLINGVIKEIDLINNKGE